MQTETDETQRPPRPAQSAAAARVGGGVGMGEGMTVALRDALGCEDAPGEDPRAVYAEHGKPFDTLRSLFSKLPESVRMDAELALDQIAARVAADETDAARWRACGKIAARAAAQREPERAAYLIAWKTAAHCYVGSKRVGDLDADAERMWADYVELTAGDVADALRGDVRLLLDCKAALLGAVYSEDGLDGADADRLARRIDAALAATPEPTGAVADALARAERERDALGAAVERAAYVFDRLAEQQDAIADGTNHANARAWAPMRAQSMRRHAADCRAAPPTPGAQGAATATTGGEPAGGVVHRVVLAAMEWWAAETDADRADAAGELTSACEANALRLATPAERRERLAATKKTGGCDCLTLDIAPPCPHIAAALPARPSTPAAEIHNA